MGLVPKSNRTIVEKGIIYAPNTLAWYRNFNKTNGRLSSLYEPVLITLLVLINGVYGNEHNNVGVCMSQGLQNMCHSQKQ
jgi:hypothetical protein